MEMFRSIWNNDVYVKTIDNNRKTLANHLEIGKRDFYGHAKLDMMGFTENKTFVGIDARHMEAERPALCGRWD